MFIDIPAAATNNVEINDTGNALSRLDAVYTAGEVYETHTVLGWYVVPLLSVFDWASDTNVRSLCALNDLTGSDLWRLQTLVATNGQIRLRAGPNSGGTLRTITLTDGTNPISRQRLQYQADGVTPITELHERVKILWAARWVKTNSTTGTVALSVVYEFPDGTLVSIDSGTAAFTWAGSDGSVATFRMGVHAAINAAPGAQGFVTVKNEAWSHADVEAHYRNVGQTSGTGDPVKIAWSRAGSLGGRDTLRWSQHGGVYRQHGSDTAQPDQANVAREFGIVRSDNINMFAVRDASGADTDGDWDAGPLGACTVTQPASGSLTWLTGDRLGFEIERDAALLRPPGSDFSAFTPTDGIRTAYRDSAAYQMFSRTFSNLVRVVTHGNSRSFGSIADGSERWSGALSNIATAISTRGYGQGLILHFQRAYAGVGVSGFFTTANPVRSHTGAGAWNGNTGNNRNQADRVLANSADARGDLARAGWATAATGGTRVGGADIMHVKSGGYIHLLQPNIRPVEGDAPMVMRVGILATPTAPATAASRRIWTMGDGSGLPPTGNTATPGNDEQDVGTTTVSGLNTAVDAVPVTSYTAGTRALVLDNSVTTPPEPGQTVIVSNASTYHVGMVESYDSDTRTITLETALAVAPTISGHTATWGDIEIVMASAAFDGTEVVGSDPPDYRGISIEVGSVDDYEQVPMLYAEAYLTGTTGLIVGEIGMGGDGYLEQFDLIWDTPRAGQRVFERVIEAHEIDLILTFPATQNMFSGVGTLADAITLRARPAITTMRDIAESGGARLIYCSGPYRPSSGGGGTKRFSHDTGNTPDAVWNVLAEDIGVDRVISIQMAHSLGHPEGQYGWGFRQNAAHETARGVREIWNYLYSIITSDDLDDLEPLPPDAGGSGDDSPLGDLTLALV